jgi:TonB family protein
LIQITRERENVFSIELERLDSSWLHYRVTVYETNAENKAIMRSAFTIPSTMTMKDAVVFGFEDSTRRPLFLSLRMTNLFAEGKDARKAGTKAPARKLYAMALAGRTDEWTQSVTAFEKGAIACRGEIKPPQLKSAADPEYPENAIKNGIEGIVILMLKVDEKGRVVDAIVLRSIPELDQAALDAVNKWTYKPLLVEGRPRTCVFTSTVNFSLDTLKAAKGEPAKKPDITAPRLYYYIPPIYPEAAKAKGIGGTVILSVTLDNGGNVIAVRALQSIPELDHAAIDAVKQWKYVPMLVNGSPRGVVFTVSVEFKR